MVSFRGLLLSYLTVFFTGATCFGMFKGSYTYIAPTQSDPGNEITQREGAFEFSDTIHTSADGMNIYGAGLSFVYTQLEFDEDVLGTVDLTKIMVPFTGAHILSKETLITWTAAPGLHGENKNFTDSEFRVQGQFTFVLPRDRKQWVLGAGFGDSFGETKVFPVIGAIWTLSENSKFTTVFPLIKYEYTTEGKTTFNGTIKPIGSKWTWEPGSIGNKEAGNIELSGVQISGGADFSMTDNFSLFASAGIVTGRKFKATRKSDSSVNATVDLKDSWLAQAGISYQ